MRTVLSGFAGCDTSQSGWICVCTTLLMFVPGTQAEDYRVERTTIGKQITQAPGPPKRG